MTPIALESVRLLAARPGQPPVNLYKNNADGKGQSYGTHENYLMPRRTPFPEIVRGLIPFFVTRQVVCGAGRVGLGSTAGGRATRSPSAPTSSRPRSGSRPRSSARSSTPATSRTPSADRYRRLHVIIGDANHLDVATLLKTGTTSLVLGMIEDGHLTEDWSVRRPVPPSRRSRTTRRSRPPSSSSTAAR